MKIMFVTPSMHFGGAERVMSLLCNEGVKQANEVVLVIMDDSRTVAYPLDDRVSVEFLPGIRINGIKSVKRIVSVLKNVITEQKPDAIISFFNSTMTFVWLAARKLSIPLVFSERNDPNNNINGWKAKLFQHFALKKSDHVVFQTEGARSYYGKKIREKSSVIINPFSTDNLPGDYLGEREKTIVSVGRLSPQKNQKLLIEAFALVEKKYPEYKLVIYGEGPLRSELESLAAERGISEKVLLPGADKNVLAKINSASMFAFSSDFEGLPNALIEAMAVGLPCVSTDCSPGGARELIKNYNNGIVVPCGDAGELAKACEYILSDPTRASAMGNEAKKIVNDMKIEQIFDLWCKILSGDNNA